MKDSLRERLKVILETDNFDDSFELSNIDSLSRAELIVTFEEELGLSLTNQQILGLKTLGDLTRIKK